MAVIEILSGPIKSGKTTNLMKWVSSKKNIDGILQPIIENKRFFYSIGNKTLKQLEFSEGIPPNDAIRIGKYIFSRAAFNWAQNNLRQIVLKNPDYIIIDEVGKLELDGLGLEPVISELINTSQSYKGTLIFVVRDSLFEKFISLYKLENKYNLFTF